MQTKSHHHLIHNVKELYHRDSDIITEAWINHQVTVKFKKKEFGINYYTGPEELNSMSMDETIYKLKKRYDALVGADIPEPLEDILREWLGKAKTAKRPI